MKIHLIAIGGAVMHNLAIALHKKGYEISGSDDKIFEPSLSKLKMHGLLPPKTGWFPEKITKETGVIILGMHARENNPEIKEAQRLSIKIYSFPEFIFQQCRNKTRVVIGGSHGKTTITSMVVHVLKENKVKFDYLAGAQIEGFDTMVGLSEEAEIAILEGDEYLSSAIDRRPKFHLYRPHIALLTGIAWDHVNVFPTFENYCEQFEIFINQSIVKNGTLYYYEKDENIQKILKKKRRNIGLISYNTHDFLIKNSRSILQTKYGDFPLQIFGEHNLQNLMGAKLICMQLGISEKDFYGSISRFKGASRRLQTLAKSENSIVFYDFAHSPSKLKATIEAVKLQYPARKIIACMELHTFSSLNKQFLPQYKGTMEAADRALVYFNPETVKHKKLKKISTKRVAGAFASPNVEVFTHACLLFGTLQKMNFKNTVLLLMSSGNFDGKDLEAFAKNLVFISQQPKQK